MKTLYYSLLLFLKWIPRIVSILMALFVSVFALDSFSPEVSFWKSLPGFLIQLIPAFLIILILILSWKREWIGGIFFVVLGIVYIIWSSRSGNGTHLIDVPLFLIGMLFMASWLLRKEIREADKAYWGD